MRTNAELLKAARTVRRGATGFAARARAERRGVLSLNQTAVLGMLFKQESITPGEVAHRLRTQPQTLTRTFAALEEQGWIRRLPDPSDGRQSLLTITAAGREMIADEMRPRDEWVARAMERELTDVECDLLVLAARLLERLAEVDAAVAPPEAAVTSVTSATSATPVTPVTSATPVTSVTSAESAVPSNTPAEAAVASARPPEAATSAAAAATSAELHLRVRA